MQIKFTLPTKDSPGYLRRAKTVLELQESMKEPTVKALDNLVEFLAQYVEEPADHAAAVDALLDASEEQLMGLLNAVGGGGSENPTG